MTEEAQLYCGVIAPHYRLPLSPPGFFSPAVEERGAVLVDEPFGLLFLVNRAGELEVRDLERGGLFFKRALGVSGSGPLLWLDEQLLIATSEGELLALDDVCRIAARQRHHEGRAATLDGMLHCC